MLCVCVCNKHSRVQIHSVLDVEVDESLVRAVRTRLRSLAAIPLTAAIEQRISDLTMWLALPHESFLHARWRHPMGTPPPSVAPIAAWEYGSERKRVCVRENNNLTPHTGTTRIRAHALAYNKEQQQLPDAWVRFHTHHPLKSNTPPHRF